MTTNYHITKNALEVRVPGTTDIDDCGTMDFHFDLQLQCACALIFLDMHRNLQKPISGERRERSKLPC